MVTFFIGTATHLVILPPHIPWIVLGDGILLLHYSMICVVLTFVLQFFLLHFVSDDVLVPRSEGQLIWIDAIGIPIDALGNKWPLKATKLGDFGLHFLCPEVFDFRFQNFLEVVVQPLGHKTINRFCHNWILRGAEWSLHLTLIIGTLGCGWLVHT